MDRISFPYRSASHLALLHVVAESGAWEKHGLTVDYDRPISKSEAHTAIASGAVDFVGGNHVSTYGHRARGDNWVYLGQTMNAVRPKLAVRPDDTIDRIADLKGRKIGTQGNHPGLNDWLYLRQHALDVDRGDIEIINRREIHEAPSPGKPRREPLWQWVADRKVDAVFLVEPPDNLFAEQAGLKIIDVDPFPMIWFTTISSSLAFVEKHPDIVERFLKGLIEGIHFFKTESEKSVAILMDKITLHGRLDEAKARYAYSTLRNQLEPKLYPTLAAIANVYEEAKRMDADAAKINPMELWDLHHLRRIEDSGFVAQLYRAHASGTADPERDAEQARKEALSIAAVKSCGHFEFNICGCP